MCGISGFVDTSGRPVSSDAVSAQNRAAHHRGPDAAGTCAWRNVALGHTRLRIIDIEPGSDQPFHSGDGTLTLVYNGEIYNYLELREELRGLGHDFRTASDTEVLLHAYREWGEACTSRFNGMWAFALLDKARGVLFCSRDRFGVKPFHYLEERGRFAFASEIKQLVPLLAKRRPDMVVLKDFLLTQITNIGEATFFDGIKCLLPGHQLVVDLATGTVNRKRYYVLARDERVAVMGPDEAIEAFRALFESSVRLRMRSDVRVGTCLSGGLDSSSVATVASHVYDAQGASGPFAAITAVSTQADNDETPYAGSVVASRGLEWFRTRPDYQDFTEVLDDVAYTQDEPYGSPSIIMQYYVMKTARENGVTVLLDGQGGDETLLGYEKYYIAAIRTMLRQHGKVATLDMLRQVIRNNDNMSWYRTAFYYFGGRMATSRWRVYRQRNGWLREMPEMPRHLAQFAAASDDPFRLQKLECESTNLPVLLRYEDRNSMAHSIEARLPFLDYRLLEFCLSLPIELKIRDGWTKWLLRRAMDGEMPSEIVWRKNKKGFEAPESQWLNRHHQTMFDTVTTSPLIASIADLPRLRRMFPVMDMRSQWRLYSTALWERAFSVTSA